MRFQLFAFLGGTAAICASCMIAATSVVSQDSGKPARLNVERVPTNLPDQRPIGREPWQLARTPSPAGGLDTISITKVADSTRSDHDVQSFIPRGKWPCGWIGSSQMRMRARGASRDRARLEHCRLLK